MTGAFIDTKKQPKPAPAKQATRWVRFKRQLPYQIMAMNLWTLRCLPNLAAII